MEQPVTNWTVAVDADTTPLRNELLKASSAGRQFGNLMTRAFEGVALQGKSLTEVVRNVGLGLSHIALNAAFRPLGNLFGNAFTNAIGGGGLAFAQGGVLDRGVPLPFASGGVIASPVTFPLGSGTGLAGERGAEAIMPLARGPDGRLGVAASGMGGGVNVTLNVTTPDADSFRRSETQVAALLARVVSAGQRGL